MSFIVCTMCWKSQNQLSATINCLRAISTVFQRKKPKTIHLRDPHWQKSPRVARVSSLSKNVVLNAFNASNFKEKEKPPECQTITIYVYIYVSVCMCLCVYAAL